ncbi:U7 snRNA-associated Sm-like protein LSm11 [Aethina tumida]|uniref:U7 snRNA-associated Sm-like protein LSm11 n=1 Tax=Aethina tumida TaxID=116153 RepID=UPI00096B1CD1|nr:U7 snRNA-associated Sm-like protein LSm11 [Aethina tumida]
MASAGEPADKIPPKNRDSSANNPRLDFFSDKFDPLLALKTAGLKPPVPKAKCHDNMSKLKLPDLLSERKQNTAVVGKKRDDAAAGTSKTTASGESVRRFEPHQMPVQNTKKVNKTNIYTKMESIAGPLSLLRKCKDERIKIKIWTRFAWGLRGFCIAYLVAFDKQWNLAMEDVTEYWIRPKKRKTYATETLKVNVPYKLEPPKVTVLKTTKRFEICQRYVEQIVMRGEHVAVIKTLNQTEESQDMELLIKQLTSIIR